MRGESALRQRAAQRDAREDPGPLKGAVPPLPAFDCDLFVNISTHPLTVLTHVL